MSPNDTTLSPADTISWAPEVIADSTGKWCRNALRFATESEAMASATELAMRWFAVREWRAAPAIEPVTHRFDSAQMRNVEITR